MADRRPSEIGPPTVAEAMRFGALRRAHLVAGRAGIDRRIEWVRVMETPGVVRRMGPRELLLTSAYAVRGDVGAQARLVSELAAIDGAGIVVTLGEYLSELPAEMIAEADRCGLPLLQIAADVSRIDLMEPLLARIINAEHWRLKRSIEIHRRFTDLVLDGKGIVDICATLAEIVEGPVVVEDATFHLLAHAGDPGADPHRRETIAHHGSPPRAIFDPRFQRVMRDVERRRGPTRVAAMPHLQMNRDRIIAPILANRRLLGYLSIIGGEQPEQEELAMMAIEQAALVVAIALAQERELADVESQVRGEYLDELLHGTYGDVTTAQRRARHLGYPLAGRHLLVVADIDDFRDYLAGQHLGEDAIQELKRQFLHRVSDAVRPLAEGVLFLPTSDSVVALLPLGGAVSHDRGRTLGERIQEAVRSWDPGFSVTVVHSDPIAVPAGVAAAYREVRGVLDTLARFGARGHVAAVAEQGLTGLLAGVPDQRLEAFADRHLGTLIRHDTDHGHHLVATLRAYLETGEQQAAARRLGVHANTLRYRLDRIRTISGLELEDPEVHLNLTVALRVQALLGGEGG